jgi:UDP-N-acetylmuramate--alanine ligase
MAMAQLNGCTAEELRYGMKTYRGVDRRFDFRIRNDKHVLLSDYAHHPKEIFESARSMREVYKNRHITAIFSLISTLAHAISTRTSQMRCHSLMR